MNKLWIRLSFAFFGVIALTVITIFSIIFAASWLGEEDFSAESFDHEYQHLTDQYVFQYIIEGKSDEEIVSILGGDARVQSIVDNIRGEGYGPGSVEDLSFGRIAADYFVELTSPETFIIILIGTLIGIAASIFVARQLTRPLAELTMATDALRQNDLTQRVSAEGDIEVNALANSFNQMADRLERSEEVRQNMLADVSHELRTPLAGLEGTLRATLDGVFELNDEHVGNLYSQTQHLTQLVDDLHLLARAEAHRLKLETVSLDLTVLLKDLIAGFEVLAQDKRIHLDGKAIGPAPLIEGDSMRLRQVFSNLLSNALRHTPEGGEIRLSTKALDGSIEVTIQDNGEGIDGSYLPHLFDRFYRVDQSRSRDRGGSGLGLAITKALVEAHGGTIVAYSDGVGSGSRFCVTLPDVVE